MDLEKVTIEQFNPVATDKKNQSITAVDLEPLPGLKNKQLFTWGVGPYITHRLFNPDLPLSLETGVEVEAGYKLAPGLKISGAIRKSMLAKLTDNKRRSNSVLPRVHSDWPLYDFAGQNSHIHKLTLSYLQNLAPGLCSLYNNLLEPLYGVGGEILCKPAHWPVGIGLDPSSAKKRLWDAI